MVQQLLDKGARVETRDWHGQTPLSWAAENGRVGVVWLLVDRGAWLDTQDWQGQTPLFWASANDHDEVVRLLMSAQQATTSLPTSPPSTTRAPSEHVD